MSDPFPSRPRTPGVLVVDDNEAVRAITRRALEGAGYQVWEAADGVQAIGFLAQGVVDAVVTDIRMPGMDGWELASHVKAMTPGLPILFMSAYDAHLGCSNIPGPVLAKPFRVEELVAGVRKLLLDHQPRSA